MSGILIPLIVFVMVASGIGLLAMFVISQIDAPHPNWADEAALGADGPDVSQDESDSDLADLAASASEFRSIPHLPPIPSRVTLPEASRTAPPQREAEPAAVNGASPWPDLAAKAEAQRESGVRAKPIAEPKPAEVTRARLEPRPIADDEPLIETRRDSVLDAADDRDSPPEPKRQPMPKASRRSGILPPHRAAALGIMPPTAPEPEPEADYDPLGEEDSLYDEEPSTAMGHLRWDHERQELASMDDSIVEGHSDILGASDLPILADPPSATEQGLSGLSVDGLPLNVGWTDELPHEVSASINMDLPMDVSMSIDMDLPAELLQGSAGALSFDDDDEDANVTLADDSVAGPIDHILDAEGPVIPGSSILRKPIDPVSMRSDMLFESVETVSTPSFDANKTSLDDTGSRDPLDLDDLPNTDNMADPCDDEASIWFEIDQQHLRGGDLIEKLRERQN
jgi:hypothetical protein